jgi:hypothetical protein
MKKNVFSKWPQKMKIKYLDFLLDVEYHLGEVQQIFLGGELLDSLSPLKEFDKEIGEAFSNYSTYFTDDNFFVISLNTDDRKILWLLEFWFIQQVSSYYTGSTIKVESNNNIKNNEFKKFVFDIENITQLEINSMRSTLETKNRFLKERIKTNKDLIKILDRLEEPFIEEECQLLHEDSIHEDENGNT